MKKYLYFLTLLSYNCFAQVNSNNLDSKKNNEVISFNKVDQIPIFENCKNEKSDLQRDCVVNFINTHIEKNLKYPKEAKKVNIESKVFCTFIIDEEGKITITEAKGKPTSFKKAFENEAIRLLNLLPKFIPAKHNNQIVKVQAQYTVEFKLENSGIIRLNKTAESDIITVKISEPQIIGEPEFSEEVTIPFSVIEQIPLFNSCKNVEKTKQRECFQEEIKKHIEKHLEYPKEAKKNKITARVIVIFEISKEGKISNIRNRVTATNKEYSADFEKEALRIINKLPQFIPGQQRGKTVVVSYAIPIIFSLTDK